MAQQLKNVFVVLLFLGVVGCATGKTTVVLAPDPDGTVGSISVSNKAGSVEIDQPNQATVVRGDAKAPAEPVVLEGDAVENIFSEAIAIQPMQPVHFILYFQDNSSLLLPESKALISDILSAIKARNAENISVVGHTDTAGDEAYNRKLSKNRALTVSNLLVERGVREDYIQTTSHGEENPLIKTGDNVSEPKNRRVEVVVR